MHLPIYSYNISLVCNKRTNVKNKICRFTGMNDVRMSRVMTEVYYVHNERQLF